MPESCTLHYIWKLTYLPLLSAASEQRIVIVIIVILNRSPRRTHLSRDASEVEEVVHTMKGPFTQTTDLFACQRAGVMYSAGTM